MLSLFTNNRSKLLFLLLLIVIVGLITYFRIKLQIELGAVLDTFDYLANAAEFAGHGIGYTDLNRPPVISFLTSIFFLFGGLSITPVFFVDGFLFLVGCIGLYLFFNERFSPIISFVGSLLFSTFPIVLVYVGAGFNDVSSVGVSIWAIYLTYLAVEKNSKWFYLSFPVAMLAFLTRFNMALLIFPIFFYIFINWNKIQNRKNILIGIFLSLLVILPFIVYIGIKLGNPLYTFMDFFRTSESGVGTSEHFAYHPDPLYYLKNLINYIGAQSVVIIVFFIVGFIGYWFKKFKEPIKWNRWLNVILKQKKYYYKLGLMVALIIIFLFTFGKVHYLATEFIFLALAYITYIISKDLGIKDWRIDLLFISWFMAFFIFQSVSVTKDHRYFISMIAPLSYFFIRAYEWTITQLRLDFKGKNLTLYIITLTLMILMLLSTVTQLIDIEKDNQNAKLLDQDFKQASYWLIKYDPQYKSKLIYSDFWSYFAWYLQMDVGKMPIFRNNQIMYVGPKDYNFTKEDNNALDRELEKIRPDYYISAWKGMNFTSYEPIARFGTVTIFKRKN